MSNFLVIRLSALGDCVLTTGVLRFWHEERNIRFTVLTRAAFAPIFENNPAVEEIIAARPEDLTDWLRFCRKLKKEKGGLPLIDLHGNLRSHILRMLWSNYCYAYPKMSLTRRIFQQFHFQEFGQKLLRFSVPQRYCMAFTSRPPHAAELRPQIFLTVKEILDAKNTLSELEIYKPPIVLHPYAKHDNKTWHAQRWRELTQELDARGENWLIIGQNRQKLIPESKFDLTNKTDLRQTCAIIQSAKAFVSADSGPMHLATALQTPVVALFGPTTRHWGFFPSGENDIVLEKDLACRPCSLHGNKDCPHRQKCLRQITIQDVIDAIFSK